MQKIFFDCHTRVTNINNCKLAITIFTSEEHVEPLPLSWIFDTVDHQLDVSFHLIGLLLLFLILVLPVRIEIVLSEK